MSFYTRFLGVVLVGIPAIALANLDRSVTGWLILLCLLLVTATLVWVSILTWNRPENLLYGADTHFKKWQMQYGTEQGAAGRDELAVTSGNPDAQ